MSEGAFDPSKLLTAPLEMLVWRSIRKYLVGKQQWNHTMLPCKARTLYIIGKIFCYCCWHYPSFEFVDHYISESKRTSRSTREEPSGNCDRFPSVGDV